MEQIDTKDKIKRMNVTPIISIACMMVCLSLSPLTWMTGIFCCLSLLLLLLSQPILPGISHNKRKEIVTRKTLLPTFSNDPIAWTPETRKQIDPFLITCYTYQMQSRNPGMTKLQSRQRLAESFKFLI